MKRQYRAIFAGSWLRHRLHLEFRNSQILCHMNRKSIQTWQTYSQCQVWKETVQNVFQMIHLKVQLLSRLYDSCVGTLVTQTFGVWRFSAGNSSFNIQRLIFAVDILWRKSYQFMASVIRLISCQAEFHMVIKFMPRRSNNTDVARTLA